MTGHEKMLKDKTWSMYGLKIEPMLSKVKADILYLLKHFLKPFLSNVLTKCQTTCFL